jgi:hypothetical protein
MILESVKLTSRPITPPHSSLSVMVKVRSLPATTALTLEVPLTLMVEPAPTQ